MNTPTSVDTLNPLETLHLSTDSSPLDTSAGRSNKRPAIRVLAGPLRIGSYQPFPILLDASDPLVQESETQDGHMVMLVSPQRRQQGSAQANGVSAWTSQMKGRFSAFALRAVARLRRVLGRE